MPERIIKHDRTPLALEVLARLRRLSTEIDALDHRVALRYRLNRSDLHCLDVIADRGPIRPSELARAVHMTSGGLSIALDRLEKAGYITRRSAPEDRRGIWVEVTETTRRLDEETFAALNDRLHRVVEGYCEEELQAICDFLGRSASEVAATGRP